MAEERVVQVEPEDRTLYIEAETVINHPGYPRVVAIEAEDRTLVILAELE